MSNERTEHSRLGIASFLLALIPGLLFAALILLFAILLRTVSQPQEYAAGWGVLVLLVILMILVSEILALVLGIAGVLQKRRKRLFAFLGIALSVLVFVSGYVQDLVLPVWM